MSETPDWIVLTALSKFFTVAEVSGITELGFNEEDGDGNSLHIRIQEEPDLGKCAYTVYVDGDKHSQVAMSVVFFSGEEPAEETRVSATKNVKVKANVASGDKKEPAKKDETKENERKAEPPSKKDKEPLGKK